MANRWVIFNINHLGQCLLVSYYSEDGYLRCLDG